MPKSVAVTLACLLLTLALAPWIVSSCASPPLMPEALVQERAHYESTVDAARTATMVAQRSAESERSVVVLGTAPVTVVASGSARPVPAAGAITATLAATMPADLATLQMTLLPRSAVPSASSTATTTLTLRPTSIVTIRIGHAGPTPTATTKVIVVQSRDATPVPLISATDVLSVTATAVSTTSPAAVAPTQPAPPPANMIDVDDVITDQMLNAQVQQDAGSDSVTDLTIELGTDGIHALGRIVVFPGLRRPIEMHGTFAVEEERLVAVVNSIVFDGRDVTEQYHQALEDRVNWSLYKLLPQRYVRSYELSSGQVKVHSQMRPQ